MNQLKDAKASTNTRLQISGGTIYNNRSTIALPPIGARNEDLHLVADSCPGILKASNNFWEERGSNSNVMSFTTCLRITWIHRVFYFINHVHNCFDDFLIVFVLVCLSLFSDPDRQTDRHKLFLMPVVFSRRGNKKEEEHDSDDEER